MNHLKRENLFCVAEYRQWWNETPRSLWIFATGKSFYIDMGYYAKRIRRYRTESELRRAVERNCNVEVLNISFPGELPRSRRRVRKRRLPKFAKFKAETAKLLRTMPPKLARLVGGATVSPKGSAGSNYTWAARKKKKP